MARAVTPLPEPDKPADRLSRSLVWFALGMVAMGVAGAVAAITWLDAHIEERLKASDFLKAHAGPPGPPGVKGDPGTPGRDGSVPIGAVVAFDLADGCPTGWTAFGPATGRTIVGASQTHSSVSENRDVKGNLLTSRVYRSDGGEEMHTLTIPEMPSHSHKLDTLEGVVPETRPGNSYSGWTNGPKISGPWDAVTAKEGGGQPHNTMPPFVSLYFCKRAS